MPLEDKQVRRLVEREIAKHSIEYSLLTVAVINQVAYLGGTVSPLRGMIGRDVDITREMALICEAITSIKGVNDVVNDVRIVS